jgi:hypothetical protein
MNVLIFRTGANYVFFVEKDQVFSAAHFFLFTEKSMFHQHPCKTGRPLPRTLQTGRVFKKKNQTRSRPAPGSSTFVHTDTLMSFVPAPDFPEGHAYAQPDSVGIPPLRWIMVGYFFWVGIFLGALIMHSATAL